MSRATMVPGTFFVTHGHSKTIASVITAVTVAVMLTEPAARARATNFATNSLWNWLSISSCGIGVTWSPKKSLISFEAIIIAIPFVNPIVTDRGMNRTVVPRPVMPITISITPAIAV